MRKIRLREYQSSDCEECVRLFYQTVHSVNALDYTEEQLNVWAPEIIDTENWDKSFVEHYAVVASMNGEIVGFGDMEK